MRKPRRLDGAQPAASVRVPLARQQHPPRLENSLAGSGNQPFPAAFMRSKWRRKCCDFRFFRRCSP